jgi:hypothetical protein
MRLEHVPAEELTLYTASNGFINAPGDELILHLNGSDQRPVRRVDMVQMIGEPDEIALTEARIMNQQKSLVEAAPDDRHTHRIIRAPVRPHGNQ